MSYWDNICEINAKQESKGISKYGITLEDNDLLTVNQRIEHAQEEAIDFLKYTEHLKVALKDNFTFADFERYIARAMEYDSDLAEFVDKFDKQNDDDDTVMKLLGVIAGYCIKYSSSLQELAMRLVDRLTVDYPEAYLKSAKVTHK